MGKITLPKTLKEATVSLNGIDALLTAKGWERAAIVFAFTEPGTNQHDSASRKVVRLPIKQFAELGIQGLKTQDTVRFYREAWLEGGGDPTIQPGDTVTLPIIGFPPSKGTDAERERVRVEPGSSDDQIQRAVKTMTPHQRTVAAREALLDPDVARAITSEMDEDDIADIVETHVEAVGLAVAKNRPALDIAIRESLPKGKISSESQAKLEKLSEDLDVAFRPVMLAVSVINDIKKVFGAWYARDPEAADDFLRFMEESIADLRLSKEGSVSDSEIAAFIDALEGGM